MGYKRVSSILNKEQEKQFQEWMEDGNVIEFEDGYSKVFDTDRYI